MGGHRVAIFAPSVWVSVTIEPGPGEHDDIHVHAAGQGIWVARMLHQLGEEPVVCAPVGGEGGEAFEGLTQKWGIDLSPVATQAHTPVHVDDRRSGERQAVARSRPPRLDRHEIDQLYNVTLEAALAAERCVITGRFPKDPLPTSFYRRLGADLSRAGVPLLGDLHGPELAALLEGGPLDLLKVSDGDLVEDGLLADHADEEEVIDVTRELASRGVGIVVVSRADSPTILRSERGVYRGLGPRLDAVDTTGSGDSMTAVLASGRCRGLEDEELLRRSWAAGAANVTRHGLGGASPGLVEGLSERVEIERLEAT